MSDPDGRGAAIRIRERGQTEVTLTRAQAAELRGLGICAVQPGVDHQRWIVSDVTAIGNVVLDGIRVVIEPKLELRSVLHMASLAESQLDIGDEVFDAEVDRSLPTAIASALIDAIDAAVTRGLRKGYREVEETGQVMRGRWDISRQLRTRPGMPIPLELTIDEFTEDTDENRILHTALRQVLKIEGLPPEVLRRARHLLAIFSEVRMLHPGEPVPVVHFTRLNGFLKFPVFLARLMLQELSWTHSLGAARAGTFLINMAPVFEAFIGNGLRDALRPMGVGVDLQDSSWRLDEGKRIVLRPDIVLRRNGRPIAVADTKYKVFGASAGSPPNADVYQAVAYALALGLGEAHLIYAAGDIEPRRYEIPSAGVSVVAHAVTLEGTPAVLRARVSRLAREISAPTVTELSA